MTTLMSPRNMLIAGIVLILLNVAAIAPAATGAVEDVVDETFASYTKDTICADADCTEAEEDWASSTAQRDYYAWDVTNLADVMAGEASSHRKGRALHLRHHDHAHHQQLRCQRRRAHLQRREDL